MTFPNLLRAPLSLSLALLAVVAACVKKSPARATNPSDDTGMDTTARIAELTRLSRHLLTDTDMEKARLARVLHDGLGSTLTAVNLDLSWLQQRMTDQPAFAQRLARAREVLASTVQMKRDIMHDLHPTALDTLGLCAAIESYAVEFARATSLQVETELPEDLPAPARGAPIALFRICQEALTNAALHARASVIKISVGDDEASTVLTVSDNGTGIAAEKIRGTPATTGLLIMHERAASLGGTCSVTRGQNGGTVVTVSIPRAEMGAPHVERRAATRS